MATCIWIFFPNTNCSFLPLKFWKVLRLKFRRWSTNNRTTSKLKSMPFYFLNVLKWCIFSLPRWAHLARCFASEVRDIAQGTLNSATLSASRQHKGHHSTEATYKQRPIWTTQPCTALLLVHSDFKYNHIFIHAHLTSVKIILAWYLYRPAQISVLKCTIF